MPYSLPSIACNGKLKKRACLEGYLESYRGFVKINAPESSQELSEGRVSMALKRAIKVEQLKTRISEDIKGRIKQNPRQLESY